jgi:hypothetical protein
MLVKIGLLAGLSGCLIPLAIPGSRVDGGFSLDGHFHVRAGTHVASYRKSSDASWDLGAGYALGDAGTMYQGAQGVYVEASYLQVLGDNLRLGVGPGVEALFPTRLASVAYLRTAIEMFTPVESRGVSKDRCGFVDGSWIGQLGLGGYVDMQKPLNQPGVAVVFGLSVRLPLFGGVAVIIPGCKDP